MTERPILFNAAMVQAILAGTKTQTRRVIKTFEAPYGAKLVRIPRSKACIKLTDDGLVWNPYGGSPDVPWEDGAHDGLVACPYGKPGDRMWVREAWGCKEADHPRVPDGRKPQRGDSIVYRADPGDAWQWRGRPGDPGMGDFVWRPSIHMPRWASRIDLEVTSVRAEQLQDISAMDAAAEGLAELCPCDAMIPGYGCTDCMGSGVLGPPPKYEFRELWDSINAKRGYPWESNPWVWVIEFKRIRP